MAKFEEAQPNLHNTIMNGTEIVGDINTNGDIRLDGSLTGNLNSKGKVVIGPTGIVAGTITCKNADIFGKIEGKLKISELLSLKNSGIVKGEILTNKLGIEPGCKFTGTCAMDNMPADDRKPIQQPPQPSKGS